MSIYNRKMFKRNARNALNNTAGVQNFFNGGQINVRGRIPGARPVFASQPFGVGGPSRSFGVARDGRVFTFPTTANTMSGALDLGIAKKAMRGGLGSLTVPEEASLTSRGAGFAARRRAENLVGTGTGFGKGISAAADVLGQLAGGVTGGATRALATSDTPNQDTVGGRFAGMTPSEDYLTSLGINVMDFSNRAGSQGGRSAQDVANLQAQQYQSAVDAADRDAGVVRPTTPDSPPFTDQQAEVREREDEAATAAGEAYFDEKLGIMRPGTDPEIQRLLTEERNQKEVDEIARRNQEEQERAAGRLTESDTDTETETKTETKTGTGTKTGELAEEYDDAIIRQARNANASQGIPSQDSAQSEVTTAIESGTDSPAAIKAEFLKLLPKYEEDDSVTRGLNIALMGFTIASGTSEDALTNFSEGMRKTLPNFIKAKEKRKAFERETDLLASKYTIERLEGDRTRGFAKNDYYVTEDFEGPDGKQYTSGQYLRLNDNGFNALQQAGLTKNIASGSLYKQLITNQASLTKARLEAEGKTIDDYYQSTPKTRKINENISVEIYYPKAGAPKGTKPILAGRESEWNAVTRGYVNDLASIAETDNALEDAIRLVDEGALGTTGLISKLSDAAKGATEGTPMQPLLAKAGLDYSKLGAGNEFENLNRIMALQSARIILNEGGKMISNQERVMVARSMGFADASIEPGTDTLNLGSYSNVFKSKKSAIDALRNVQKIIRSKARSSHAGYKEVAELVGLDLKTLQQAKQAAAGPRLQKGDDGVYDLVQSRGS